MSAFDYCVLSKTTVIGLETTQNNYIHFNCVIKSLTNYIIKSRIAVLPEYLFPPGMKVHSPKK